MKGNGIVNERTELSLLRTKIWIARYVIHMELTNSYIYLFSYMLQMNENVFMYQIAHGHSYKCIMVHTWVSIL